MDIFWNHTILPFSYNGYLYKMPIFVVSFEFCQTFDVFCPKILSWFSFNLSWFSFNCWHKCIVSDGGCSLPFPHWSGLKRYPQFDMVALPFTINKCIEKLLLRSILAFGISLVLFSLLYAGGQKRQALP